MADPYDEHPMIVTRFFVVLMLCLALGACKSSEDRAEDAFQRGLELMSEGDEARARLEFRNATRLSAAHLEAQLALGRLNLKLGAFRPAFRSFRIVVESEPDNVEAQIAISQISFLNGDWESLERYGARAIELAPENPETKIIDLATRYRQAVLDKDATARSALLEQVQAMESVLPNDRLMRRLLIDGYLSEGRFEAALTQIDNAIEDNPKNRDLYQLKVRILGQLGDNGGVETTLRRMVEVFPRDKDLQGSLLRFLIGRGQLDDAEAYMRERVASADAEDDAYYLDLVEFLKVYRSPESAMETLTARIVEKPESHSLRMVRAVMNFEAGERDTAIAEMETLIGQDAGDASFSVGDLQKYKVVLAKMLGDNGNVVGARRLIEEILSDDANDVEALKMRARWLIQEDDTNGAITALRTAMAEDPRDAEAMTLMSWAYQRTGQTDLMLDFMSLAAEASNNAPNESVRYANALLAEDRVDQAEDILIGAMRLQPTNTALLSNLGRVYLRQKNIPGARQVSEALRGMDDKQAHAVADGIDLELISLEQGTAQALEFLEQIASTRGNDDQVKLAFIRGLLQNGEVDRAVEYVDELIQDNPDRDAFVYFKALTQAAARDFEDAKTTLKQLTEADTKLVSSWMLLARLQAATGESDAARVTIDGGLAQMPESPELLWGNASFLEASGDIEDAIAVYEQLYEINSDSIIAANNLASMISTYKSDEESLNRARTIAQRLKDSEIPAFQDTYGWILYRSGETEEAVRYLEAASAGLSEDPIAQVHLGLAYKAMGRVEDAQTQLNRARAIAGPVPLPAVRQKITELEQAIAQN